MFSSTRWQRQRCKITAHISYITFSFVPSLSSDVGVFGVFLFLQNNAYIFTHTQLIQRVWGQLGWVYLYWGYSSCSVCGLSTCNRVTLPVLWVESTCNGVTLPVLWDESTCNGVTLPVLSVGCPPVMGYSSCSVGWDYLWWGYSSCFVRGLTLPVMGLLFCLWDESTCSRVSLPIPSVMSLPVIGLLFLFCPRVASTCYGLLFRLWDESTSRVYSFCFVCRWSIAKLGVSLNL